MITILLLLLALHPAPFSATWQSPTIARLSWTQPGGVRETCVTRNTTLIRCWRALPPGPAVVSLGATGPLDGAYRAQAGDTFVLSMDGAETRAELRSVGYLPIFRR